jgi:preprotein translocase subunit YajC
MHLFAVLAQEGEKTSNSGSPLGLLLPVLLFGGMYFLLIRPQRKRMRDAQALVSSIAEGDEVITTGGIYGFVNAIDGDVFWLDIAENTEIRVHRSAISRRIDPTQEAAGGAPVDAAGDQAQDGTDLADDSDSDR